MRGRGVRSLLIQPRWWLLLIGTDEQSTYRLWGNNLSVFARTIPYTDLVGDPPG